MQTDEIEDSLYHGTSALTAICIALEGFRLLDEDYREYGGGAIGSGIYVTSSKKIAAGYSIRYSKGGQKRGYLLRVRLTRGTRILRLDEQFDQRVIGSLRRKFGDDVLSWQFDRAIPRNKKLRRVEFINLFNYLWKNELLRCEKYFATRKETPLQFCDRNVRQYLAKRQFHGMGNEQDWLGVAIFNPSRLILEAVLDWSPGSMETVNAEPAQILADAANELYDQIVKAKKDSRNICRGERPRWVLSTFVEDLEYWNDLFIDLSRRKQALQRYADIHQLPTNTPSFQQATTEIIPKPIE